MCEQCGCGDKAQNTFEQKVQAIIDAIRPNLQSHGGDVELVATENDKIVKVRLQGACAGCPGAQMTLKMGIERLLKEKVPQVEEVVSVE
jgi:Fe-S cluster biogenesis protein NfuA